MTDMSESNVIPIRQSKQQKKIVALINRFPDFAGVVPEYILRDFDASALDRWASGPISDGERIIARFVLGVWDQYSNDQWKCGKFDIFEAAGLLSSGNLQVISEWVRKPFFV